ncbi:hypothetical protein [Lactococcus lactis]|uniref:Phage protein n=1 Tax=Lactococcus lactis TaxID=1358 RepID=A0AB35KCR2_9LACT|nr:hypothetical protein [Lactococcus lactis]KST89866.1 hypothetical protein LKF67_1557 [Lactococcus lactis subsp. lactis]KST98908.1 hypothetical protein KF196_1283 [Lactococcus lactis subsp. lactis]MDG4979162.1 hypothetical protein [Lactococcus lactis]MDG5048887.1 hypothetical protein [Lactococcus lactis]MDY4364012.1 hypothetical protein [Lactococcus lactis subsp. lactis]
MNDDTLTKLVARGLVDSVITDFNQYANKLLELKKDRKLPYMSKQEVISELGISDGTLDTWCKQGLQRYKPRYKTSLIYYLIDDVCKFIVLDN